MEFLEGYHIVLLTFSIQVLVSCPFWMINDTGVPLLFRQDHSQKEFANQLSEHEEASSHQPLLFSFSDVNQGDRCSVRLGKKTHTTGAPLWSSTFPIISGTESVRLFWKYGHDRPDRYVRTLCDIIINCWHPQLSRLILFKLACMSSLHPGLKRPELSNSCCWCSNNSK